MGDPRFDGNSGLGLQLRFVSLLNMGLLGCLYLNVVLVYVNPRSLDSVGFKLGSLVLDFKLHFSDCFDLTSRSA